METEILALDRNEYFSPHHPAVLRSLADCSHRESFYASQADQGKLHTELAAFLNVPPSLLAIGHGGEDLLVKILAWLRRESQTLVRLDFSWQSYVEIASGLDYAVQEFPVGENAQGFFSPIETLQTLLAQHRTPVVTILTTPNNPTGHTLSPAEIASLATQFPHHTFIVDVVYDDPRTPHLQNAVTFPNVIVLGSFSKFFGLPGIRVGYALGASIPKGFRLILGLPPSSLAAAREAIRQAEHYADNRTRMLNFSLQCRQQNWNNLRPYPSLAPFFLTEILAPEIDTMLLNKAIQEAGARPKIFSSFNRRFLRWGLGDDNANARITNFMNLISERKR
jgi:histidinol-phosphate aminotransferase